MEQFFYSIFLKFQKKYTAMLKKGSVAKNIFKFLESILINKNKSINTPKIRMPNALIFLFESGTIADSKSTNCARKPNKIIGCIKFESSVSVFENIS